MPHRQAGSSMPVASKRNMPSCVQPEKAEFWSACKEAMRAALESRRADPNSCQQYREGLRRKLSVLKADPERFDALCAKISCACLKLSHDDSGAQRASTAPTGAKRKTTGSAAPAAAKRKMPHSSCAASASAASACRPQLPESSTCALDASEGQSGGTVQQLSPATGEAWPCNGEVLWERAKSQLLAMSGRSGRCLTIFDWDDTLFPTTALDAGSDLKDLLPKLAPSLELNECAAAAVLALRCARTLGNVIIVTNAEHGWVHESASRYLPLLASELGDIPVISARSIFEPQRISDAAQWKVLCFQRIAECLQFGTAGVHGLQSLVSIGDSFDEQEASKRLGRDHPCYVKTLKLMEQPSMTHLIHQLEAFCTHLPLMMSHVGNLDIQLGEIVAKRGVLAPCILEGEILTSRLPQHEMKSMEKQCPLQSWARLGA